MCFLVALLLNTGCLPPDPRPRYSELWTIYGPAPDCVNRDRHINFLLSLKNKPLRTGDVVTVEQYDKAIDVYVERMEWYCVDQH
jgi:hypothetical protein